MPTPVRRRKGALPAVVGTTAGLTIFTATVEWLAPRVAFAVAEAIAVVLAALVVGFAVAFIARRIDGNEWEIPTSRVVLVALVASVVPLVLLLVVLPRFPTDQTVIPLGLMIAILTVPLAANTAARVWRVRQGHSPLDEAAARE